MFKKLERKVSYRIFNFNKSRHREKINDNDLNKKINSLISLG